MIHSDLAKLVHDNLNKQPLNYYNGSWTSNPVLPQNILVMPRGEAFPPSTKSLCHSRFLLAVNLAGHGTIFVDEANFSFNPGNCLLICPYQRHHFAYKTPFSWLFITFELTDNTPLLLMKNKIFQPDEEFFTYLEKTLKYGVIMNNGLFYAPEILTMLTGLLLSLLLRESEKYQKADDNTPNIPSEWLFAVQKYINSHLSSTIDYEKMASHFGYSLSHFRSLFYQKTQRSLVAYIRETRLAFALELLFHSDRKISDVAKQAGFESVFAFSHAFSKHFGKPPSYYRDRSVMPPDKNKKISPDGVIPER